MNLSEIETLTRQYADARKVVADRVEALNDEVASAYKRKMPGIKLALETAQLMKDALADGLKEAKEEFSTRRTATFHSIKVGYRKGKGNIDYADEEQVVRLIEKHFPDQAEVLVVVTKSLNKAALNELSAEELKKIGCSVEGVGDCIVIKATDSDADKLVKRLLKEGADRVEEV